MHLPGVEAPTGSLGMGLGNACGYAWALRHKNATAPANTVYCLLGDGECTEGQTWEGMGLAAQLKLDNLIAIVDYNKYIISSTTYDVMDLEPFEAAGGISTGVYSASTGTTYSPYAMPSPAQRTVRPIPANPALSSAIPRRVAASPSWRRTPSTGTRASR